MQIEYGEFKQRGRHALEDSGEYESLRQLVLRFYESGARQTDAYDALQDIWLECCYDDSSQADGKRDELEFTMERVWYWGQ